MKQGARVEFQPHLYEPSSVRQVFVLHKLVGSSAGEDRWSIKSATGQYVTAEKDGEVTCATEAVGATEEVRGVGTVACCLDRANPLCILF